MFDDTVEHFSPLLLNFSYFFLKIGNDALQLRITTDLVLSSGVLLPDLCLSDLQCDCLEIRICLGRVPYRIDFLIFYILNPSSSDLPHMLLHL